MPAAGLPVRLTTYRFVDTGPQNVDVTNWQTRFLGGLRGRLGGTWDFDTAILYSEAQATDVSPNVDMTALQRSLALSTPDAYNPFSGGCNATPAIGDCTPSSQAAIDSILFELRRQSRTTLDPGRFQALQRRPVRACPAAMSASRSASRAGARPSGTIAIRNLNGTITFTDAVTGETNLSNVAAVSPTPSTQRPPDRLLGASPRPPCRSCRRRWTSRWSSRLNVQLAARYEHYSDFGVGAEAEDRGGLGHRPRHPAARLLFAGLPRAEPRADQDGPV